MVNNTCDVCGKKRAHGDNKWILGYDLEAQTTRSVQRSIRFLDRWDDAHVLDLGAIQVCCEKCKNAYIRGQRHGGIIAA